MGCTMRHTILTCWLAGSLVLASFSARAIFLGKSELPPSEKSRIEGPISWDGCYTLEKSIGTICIWNSQSLKKPTYVGYVGIPAGPSTSRCNKADKINLDLKENSITIESSGHTNIRNFKLISDDENRRFGTAEYSNGTFRFGRTESFYTTRYLWMLFELCGFSELEADESLQQLLERGRRYR